VCLDCVVQKIN